MNKINNYKYKWRYADEECPQECCYDCRLMYADFPDMIMPDELWEKINPTYHEGGGLLCPTCIGNRLNYLGKWSGYVDILRLRLE